MNRRGFLASLIGGAAIDPERLLWRPGAKLISIPKPRVFIRFEGGLDADGCYRWKREMVLMVQMVSRELYPLPFRIADASATSRGRRLPNPPNR